MNISILVTKLNNIVIDPCVTINSGVIDGYTAKFEFQQPWDSSLELYAIFKPVNDVPIYLKLNEKLECAVPTQIYKRYAKLGIGLKGVLKDSSNNVIAQPATNLFYVPIRYSGI